VADPTRLDLTPITHSHHPTRTAGTLTCREDEQDWPCQTAQLAAEIERLRANVERLQEDLDGAHNSAWEQREHLKASREQGDLLRAQRDAVLALCDTAQVAITIACACRGINHGTEHDPWCAGYRPGGWTLNPDEIRAVYAGNTGAESR